MQSQKKKLLQFFSLKVILTGSVFIGCILCFAMIVDEVILEQEKVFDEAILGFFDTVTTPALINQMKVFTFFGSSYFLLPAYLILTVIFLLQKKFKYAIEIGVIGAISQGLLYVLKIIFHRPRPSNSLIKNITTYSFPSGHAFSSFVFCCILIYIVKHTKWKNSFKWIVSIILILLSITIGMSRIVLKVHYPTDVLGSLILGVAWIICLLLLINKLNKTLLLHNE